jgi:hypothetical protein
MCNKLLETLIFFLMCAHVKEKASATSHFLGLLYNKLLDSSDFFFAKSQ